MRYAASGILLLQQKTKQDNRKEGGETEFCRMHRDTSRFCVPILSEDQLHVCTPVFVLSTTLTLQWMLHAKSLVTYKGYHEAARYLVQAPTRRRSSDWGRLPHAHK